MTKRNRDRHGEPDNDAQAEFDSRAGKSAQPSIYAVTNRQVNMIISQLPGRPRTGNTSQYALSKTRIIDQTQSINQVQSKNEEWASVGGSSSLWLCGHTSAT
jgi:hypothetical protein